MAEEARRTERTAAAQPVGAPVEIVCVLCKRTFMFPKGAQRFYSRLAYPRPKRCRSCRNWLKLPKETRGRHPPSGPGAADP